MNKIIILHIYIMAAAPVQYCPMDFDVNQFSILLYMQPQSREDGVITYYKGSQHGRDVRWTPYTDAEDALIINPTKEGIKQIIRAISVYTCPNGAEGVDAGYVKSRGTPNTIQIILFDKRNKTSNAQLRIKDERGRALLKSIGAPISFIIGTVNHLDHFGKDIPNGELYIDVICSCTGAGRHLLDFFIDFADRTGYNAVSLSALPNVLLYYPRFGFTHRSGCKPGDNGLEVDVITQKKQELWDRKDFYRNMTFEELCDDPEFSDHLSELQEKLYGSQVGDCASNIFKNFTKAQKIQVLKRNNCGNNGYMMRKCLRYHPVRHQRAPVAAASAPVAAASAAASASASACNAQNNKGYRCVTSGGKK